MPPWGPSPCWWLWYYYATTGKLPEAPFPYWPGRGFGRYLLYSYLQGSTQRQQTQPTGPSVEEEIRRLREEKEALERRLREIERRLRELERKG